MKENECSWSGLGLEQSEGGFFCDGKSKIRGQREVLGILVHVTATQGDGLLLFLCELFEFHCILTLLVYNCRIIYNPLIKLV